MKENDNPDEIGSPDTLCTELTKLQIEYKKRVALEKSEIKDVNGRFSYYDENNMPSSDPNRKMTGEQWRNALHAGICLKANPLRLSSNTG